MAKGKSRQATVWTAEHVEEVQEAVELEEAEEEEEEVAEDDGLLFPDKESAAARKLRVQRILEVLRIDPDAVLNSATPQKVKVRLPPCLHPAETGRQWYVAATGRLKRNSPYVQCPVAH